MLGDTGLTNSKTKASRELPLGRAWNAAGACGSWAFATAGCLARRTEILISPAGFNIQGRVPVGPAWEACSLVEAQCLLRRRHVFSFLGRESDGTHNATDKDERNCNERDRHRSAEGCRRGVGASDDVTKINSSAKIANCMSSTQVCVQHTDPVQT